MSSQSSTLVLPMVPPATSTESVVAVVAAASARPRWIQVPNTLATWPWPRPREISPLYDICKAESSAWIQSFSALDESVQKALDKCIPSLLVALGCPESSELSPDKDAFRLNCDLIAFLFVIDEYTDKEAPDVVQIQTDIIMDAFHHPHISKPDTSDQWILGEMARQFWENAMRIMTPTLQRRFIDAFQTYLSGVVEEAKDRTTRHRRTVEGYFEVRRKTVAARLLFVLSEIDLDIPEHIRNHSAIETLTSLSADMIFVENDVLSYNKEQARGDPHNLITVAMREFNTDVQTAIDWAGNFHESLERQFLDLWLNTVPTLIQGLSKRAGKDVQVYCERLACWVRGNKSWSFESERYFGEYGLEIQNTCRVELLPARNSNSISVTGSCDAGQGVSSS